MRGDKVVPWGGETKLPVPVENVLEAADDAHRESAFDSIIIIGTRAGKEPHFAASDPDAAANVFYAELFKRTLLAKFEEESE